MSNLYRAQRSLIRVDAEVENNTILGIRITGDFFMVPEDALQLLEKHLTGVELDRRLLGNTVDTLYLMGIDTPMLRRDDIVDAILGVRDESKADRD